MPPTSSLASEELAGGLAVEVTRGTRVESIHAVAACACDAAGSVRFEAGTIDVPIFTRSAAKPFIAAAVLRAGAAQRFGLAPQEIAIACGSHAGEPEHLAAVTSILTKIGAGADALRCGGDPPLANNCSGKHAGILALARMLDAPLEGYLDPSHPAQRAILAFCERVFGEQLRGDRLGVDGCGIPNFAVSLRSGARAFARLARPDRPDDPDDAALRTVRDAMTAHPWFVAGTARFDTDLMLHTRGTLVAKVGAEGVQGVAVPAAGRGLVLKVVDGARRAGPPATVAILKMLGVLEEGALDALASHARPVVRNVAGRAVGEIRTRERASLRAATLPSAAKSQPA